MQGFKSFAKKADLSFNNKITIVVGPNGSGKSNIVDAVRWVLGEGSAKSLRGSKMEDVIFAGSSGKKPLGMAQVSLTLDNSTGIFPLDYSEVKVTRKLFRSGESEYLINNVKCRQRDIHELFMDTGIGRDSFSIIGQGKVDQILLSQAEEKRALVEEAAGISKYRYRKNEAKRKLTDTENSLLRVWDILKELEAQRDPLKEQAEKAKIYKEYKGELDDLEVKLSSFLIGKLEEKIEELSQEIEGKKNESLSVETSLRLISTDIEDLLLSSEEGNRQISSFQEELFSLKNSINDHENKLEFAQKMKKSLEESLLKLSLESKKNSEESAEILKKIQIENDQYQDIFQSFAKAREDLSQEEKDFEKLKSSEGGLKEKIADLKADLFDLAYEISEKRNQIIDFEKREAVIQSHETSISQRLLTNKEILSKKEEDARGREALFAEKSKEGQILDQTIAKLAGEKNLLKEKIALALEKLETSKGKLNGNQVKRQALEALEDRKEGYSAGVKSVFANSKLKGILGTVTDLADTSKEYSLALETALGASIQNIVTENEEAAKEAIDYLRENQAGRATFLPLNIINQRNQGREVRKAPQGLKSAFDIVSYQEKYENIFRQLLGNIFVARDMDQALAVNKSLSQPVRIVTLKGELLDARGAMTGGQYKKNQEGFFLRKERIRELSKEIAEAEEEIREIEATNSKYQEEDKKIDLAGLDLLETKEAFKVDLADLELKKNELNFQLSELRKERELLELEKTGLDQEKEELLHSQKLAKNNLEQEEERKKSREEELKNLLDQSEEEKDKLLDLERLLSRKELAFNDLKNKKDIKEFQLKELEKTLALLEEKKENLLLEEKRLKEEAEENEKNKEISLEAIKEEEIQAAGLEKILEEKREGRIEGEEKRKQKEEEAKVKQKLLNQLKDEIHSNEINLEKYKTERSSHKENLLERFEINYQPGFAQFKEEIDEKASKQRVRLLRRSIEELGEVNLIAISEYEKLLERYEFLDSQSSDLAQAKDSLLEIINEMDLIIEKKFKETFKLLNQAFSETFQEMFNGGNAELLMTQKDNVLETGIEIIAQPPGKNPRHLSLLSGGEKAMTAICLLFAIIKIKPGPFCILDEIEASLDESNVRRFASFLKKFAELTQFIVISHRKGTMEAGDVLYGVTMEEKGVSSLISVRISDTIKLTS